MGVMGENVVRDDASMTPPTPPQLTYERHARRLYRRLADVFHDVLSEQHLDPVLERIADTLGDLIPFDAFTIYQADETRRVLIPLMSRDKWADEIMGDQPIYGEGITGWVVENREPQLVNNAHLDPRVKVVPGTPDEPEAHLRPTRRARHGQGRAQRLPPRRGRRLHRRRNSSWPSASATLPRSRSTTRRSAPASSSRRRRTR